MQQALTEIAEWCEQEARAAHDVSLYAKSTLARAQLRAEAGAYAKVAARIKVTIEAPTPARAA